MLFDFCHSLGDNLCLCIISYLLLLDVKQFLHAELWWSRCLLLSLSISLNISIKIWRYLILVISKVLVLLRPLLQIVDSQLVHLLQYFLVVAVVRPTLFIVQVLLLSEILIFWFNLWVRVIVIFILHKFSFLLLLGFTHHLLRHLWILI